jgi:gluconate 2-dehydrogenase gamma chain
MNEIHNRRAFLRAAAAAGVAWAAADLVQVEQALAWAAQQASVRDAARLRALTRSQADVLDAMASRILPSVDGRPGAHEAGAVFFIDRALATFNAPQKGLYVEGVADLQRRSASVSPGTAFGALVPSLQDGLLRAIEKTPFFEAVRFDTIVGTFALPVWGGNRDHVGWRLLGLEHRPRFQAPFGYYDADANGSGR